MAVSEARERLRQQLEENYGVDGAAILMDRPPGGWSDLVTKDYLDAKFAATDAKFDALRHELLGAVDRRLRSQTWITASLLISGIGIAFGIGQAL
ncbi:MAG: hypothetical protein ACT4PI_00010 [Actinomycetota bacterium]